MMSRVACKQTGEPVQRLCAKAGPSSSFRRCLAAKKHAGAHIQDDGMSPSEAAARREGSWPCAHGAGAILASRHVLCSSVVHAPIPRLVKAMHVKP
jgi:hypothetical protein